MEDKVENEGGVTIKNPNRLLKKLRIAVNKSVRDILNNQPNTIIYPIPKKYLPAECYLRDLYNQAYFCHYASLYDASFSLSFICLERISRDFYNKFIGNDTNVSLNQILEQLIKHFETNKETEPNKSFLIALNYIMEIKEEARKLLFHSKINEFINNSILEYNDAINVLTGKEETLRIGYKEELHGNQKGKIKLERISQLSHNLLVSFSIIIITFNKYIDFSKLPI